MLLDEFGHPAVAKPVEFEELVRYIESSHFDESRIEIEGQYNNCKSGA